MNNKQLKLKQQAFEKALTQLEKVLAQPPSEYIRDAAIQRFEFTYELAWKTLQAYLATIDISTLSPKETLKIAYQQGLLQDANAWSMLHLQRNLTSHTYDEKLANTVYVYLKTTGLALFIELKKTLSARC
jgi:nucleotidyltransferase substrate binding protein (TIGR01987 family)